MRGLFSGSAQIWNDGKRRPYLVGDSPEAVNAEPSMLNLRFFPQRHSDLRIIALAEMYALISPRNDGSSPETKFSIEKLETEGRLMGPVVRFGVLGLAITEPACWKCVTRTRQRCGRRCP
jgi:hypothetical protein